MKFLKLLAFQESRKVAFGLWIFISANVFLLEKLIISGDWVTCMILAASLVGGGTVADKWLNAKVEEKAEKAPKGD